MTNNFRKCRKNKRLTLDEVGKILGVTKTTIYKIEKGINNPSVKNLMRFAELYDTSIDYLLGRSKFTNFSNQYNFLQSLDKDKIFDELDSLNIDEWTTKDGDIYTKLNGEWFITVKNVLS